MTSLNRRQLLKSTAALAPALATTRLSANDRVRVAVVGIRSRGRDLMNCFSELANENVELVAVCDVDESVLNGRLRSHQEKTGKKLASYVDMRQLLEDKSIDAVAHATPAHWHSLGGIWTVQAGKDAYIEKPFSHNIWEGRQVVEAARRHNAIVQHGTQCRSSPGIREGVQKLKEGVIGEVYMARGITYKYHASVGRIKPPTDPPPGVHYDLWLGPAPLKAFSPSRFHSTWQWQWDYGAGDAGNQGTHQLDLIRFGMGLNEHPTKIQAMGGKFVHKDDRETPNIHAATYSWEGRNILVEFEVRSLYSNFEAGIGDFFPFVRGKKGDSCGVIFYGSEGIMVMPDYLSWHTFLGAERTPGPKGGSGGEPMANLPHLRNFLSAVRSRKRADLNAEAEEGHRSVTLSHLANIAYRTGHALHFDAARECFVGDDQANAMLKRVYRPPYIVKENV